MGDHIPNLAAWTGILNTYEASWTNHLLLGIFNMEAQIDIRDAGYNDFESSFDYAPDGGSGKESKRTGKESKSIFSKAGDWISDKYNALKDWFTGGDDKDGGQSEENGDDYVPEGTHTSYDENGNPYTTTGEVIIYGEKNNGTRPSMMDVYFHAKFGYGEDMHVDFSTYKLDYLNISESQSINLFDYTLTDSRAWIHGEFNMDYIPDGFISANTDAFNFDIRWNEGFTGRNIVTAIGHIVVSAPIGYTPFLSSYGYQPIGLGYTPFTFYFHGYSRIGGK